MFWGFPFSLLWFICLGLKMKNYFVIGSRTSKSLSPAIFNYWFKKYNISAKYSFLEVDKKNFDQVLLKSINKKNIAGFNVTVPFKKDILKHLNTTNIHAKKIGAVNCVKIDKKNRGTNTDWAGYLKSIKGLKINKTKKILILGCGGAAQAIFYGFLSRGYKNVYVFNRSKKTININGFKTFTKKYSSIDRYLKKADLIINTTPTNPLNKHQTKNVGEQAVVSDIVYIPKQTNFLKNFKKNRKIYGISMLIEQAVLSFRFWFGFSPIVDDVLIKKLNLKIKWQK